MEQEYFGNAQLKSHNSCYSNNCFLYCPSQSFIMVTKFGQISVARVATISSATHHIAQNLKVNKKETDRCQCENLLARI